MSTPAIYLRNLVLLFCSFLWAGTQNVIPQVFFMENYASRKTLMLALFLITGTLASIAGMRAARAPAMSRLAGNRIAMGAMLAVVAGSALSFFGCKGLAVFFAAHIIMKYLSNLLYNVLDPAFAAVSYGAGRIQTHVQSVLIYQVLGIAGASLYFALCYSYTSVHIAVIGILAAAAYGFASKHLKTIRVPDRRLPGSARLSRFEKLFLAYYLVVLSLFVVFQGTLIYFLSDRYHFADAKARGGILLGVLCLVSAITIMVATALSRPARAEDVDRTVLPAALNYVPLGLFLMGTALLHARLSGSFAYVVAGCILLSIGVGMFLSTTRNCASALSVVPGRPNILKLYNNLGNYAVLLGFVIVLAISLGPVYLPVSFSIALAAGLGLLFAWAVHLVLAIERSRRRTAGMEVAREP